MHRIWCISLTIQCNSKIIQRRVMLWIWS